MLPPPRRPTQGHAPRSHWSSLRDLSSPGTRDSGRKDPPPPHSGELLIVLNPVVLKGDRFVVLSSTRNYFMGGSHLILHTPAHLASFRIGPMKVCEM